MSQLLPAFGLIQESDAHDVVRPFKARPMQDSVFDKGFRPDMFGFGAFDNGTIRRVAFLDTPAGKPGRGAGEDELFATALTAGEAVSRLFPEVSPVGYASARAWLPEVAAIPELTERRLEELLCDVPGAPDPAAALARFRAAERHASLHPLLSAAALAGNFYARMTPGEDPDPAAAAALSQDREAPACMLLGLLLALRKGYFYLAFCAPEDVMARHADLRARALGRALALKQPGIWLAFYLRCLERAAGGGAGNLAGAEQESAELSPEAEAEAAPVPSGRGGASRRHVKEEDEDPEEGRPAVIFVPAEKEAEGFIEEAAFTAPMPSELPRILAQAFTGTRVGPDEPFCVEAAGPTDDDDQDGGAWGNMRRQAGFSLREEDEGDEPWDATEAAVLCSELHEQAKRILALFEGAGVGHGLSLAEVVQRTGDNRNTLKLRLRELVCAGLLTRYGKGRGAGYALRAKT